MSEPGKSPACRKRDAEATSARIVSAAQDLFTRYGYDGVSTRDIAATAGVNVALINRYFGSKAGLFEQAIVSGMKGPEPTPEALGGLGRAKAEWLTRPKEEGFDPMTTLLRSSMSPEVREIIRKTVQTRGVQALADAIPGADREERAHLLVGIIAGLDLWLHMLEGTEGSGIDRDRLAARIAGVIDDIVSDRDPAT